jgi:hypothetical protein
MPLLMLSNAARRLRRIVITMTVRAILSKGHQRQVGCRPGGGGDCRAASGDHDRSDNGDPDLTVEQRSQFREHTGEPLLKSIASLRK